MASIGIITCLELPEPDPDQELLLDALRAAGHRAELIAWDDANGEPAAHAICIVRSCWNYYERPAAFLEWVDRTAAATRIWNPPDVLRWNSHKRYLRSLEGAGVPVIPTSWIKRRAPSNLSALMERFGWNDVVIKPAVSAGSFRTRRFKSDEVANGQTFLDALLRDCDALVQKYMPSVESPGERAIIWIDGEPTHAIIKRPRLMGDDESVSNAAEVSAADLAISRRALECVNADLLYARVDVVEDENGELVVSELELIEPSLFFLQCPMALERFVRAVTRRIASAP